MDEGTAPALGDGSEENPYQIDTLAHLKWLSFYRFGRGRTNSLFKPVTSMPRRLKTGQMAMGSARLGLIPEILKEITMARDFRFETYLFTDQAKVDLQVYFQVYIILI